MRFSVDAWDPGYGIALDASDAGGPQGDSSATVKTDVELPVESWRALVAPPHVRAPDVILLVDGVRRIDAHLWIASPDGGAHGALAASWAAGVVRCDLRRGSATIVDTLIERGIFTPSPSAADVIEGTVRYPIHRTGRDDPTDLSLAVQRALAALERRVSTLGCDAGGTPPEAPPGALPPGALPAEALPAGDLLVVDGPLHGRTHLPRALGYVKTHRVEYLGPEPSRTVTALRPGERSPVFLLGTSWHRYAWYLRLPGPGGSPWAGVVRVECSADLPTGAATALADVSAVALPRFASTAYKDPRAPQNLVPIAGLERRLRGLLGDARLLHRSLTAAARRSARPDVAHRLPIPSPGSIDHDGSTAVVID